MVLVKIIIISLKVCTLFSFWILKLYSMFIFYQVILSKSKKSNYLPTINNIGKLVEDNCTLALKWLKRLNQGSKIGLVKDFEGNEEKSAKSKL